MIEIITDESKKDDVTVESVAEPYIKEEEKIVKDVIRKEEPNLEVEVKKEYKPSFTWEIVGGAVLTFLCSAVCGNLGLVLSILGLIIATEDNEKKFKKIIYILYGIGVAECFLNIGLSMLYSIMLLLFML